jgi:hypothetical protein
MCASVNRFLLYFVVEIDIRIPLALVEFEKQTDGTRRTKLRANPDVESRFSKNYYLLNIPHMTTNQRCPELQLSAH